MSEKYESPSFQPASEKLRSSITNPIIDKISEIGSKDQSIARHLKYSTADPNVSRNYDNLGLYDLSQKLGDPKSHEVSERQSRPLRLEDTVDETLNRGSHYVQSQIHNAYYPKTAQHRHTEGQAQNKTYDFGSENIRAMPLSTKASVSPQIDQAAYIRLENEIMDLKKTLIERLDKHDNVKDQDKYAKKKSKLEDELRKKTNSDDEEEDSPYRMQSKATNLKTKEGPGKEGKGQQRSATLQKNSTKAGLKTRAGNEETLGGRTKDDKRKGDKSLTSKLRTATSASKKEKSSAAVTVEDKYENLKDKYKELRRVCREYVEKSQDLEDILKSKELQLEDYEGEIKRRHDALMEKGEIVMDLKRQIVNRDERIERLNKDYEIRFREQDEINDRLQRTLKEKEKEYNTDKEELADEIKRLKGELDIIVQKELLAIKQRDGLQEELDATKKELSVKTGTIEDVTKADEAKAQDILDLKSEIRRLKIETEELKDKNKETEQAKKEAEDNGAREKRAYEEHINRVADDRERETAKQREKFDSLKEELKKSWSIADKIKEEKNNIALALEKTALQKDDIEEELRKIKEKLRQTEKDKELLEKEVERVRAQKDESFKSVQFEAERADRIESDSKRMEIGLRTLEGKLNLKEKEAQHLQEMNEQMRGEMNGILEKSEESRDYIVKLERELNSLQNEHNEEILSLERKIEKLSKEVQLVNEENRILKTSESRLNRELNSIREEKERYRADYRDLRETNKTLEKDLKELDEKVRDVISGKALDVLDQPRDLPSFRYSSAAKQPNSLRQSGQSGSKIKVLDEIQDMIKGYRVSQKKYDPQDI